MVSSMLPLFSTMHAQPGKAPPLKTTVYDDIRGFVAVECVGLSRSVSLTQFFPHLLQQILAPFKPFPERGSESR